MTEATSPYLNRTHRSKKRAMGEAGKSYIKGNAPNCPYCSNPSVKTTGEEIYPNYKRLHDKVIFICRQCSAWVGCHPGTEQPLGRLANAELRAAKMRAHNAFDPIWKTGLRSRGDAYKWLADKLGINRLHCHIGMFDVAMCTSVVDVCFNASSGIKGHER